MGVSRRYFLGMVGAVGVTLLGSNLLKPNNQSVATGSATLTLSAASSTQDALKEVIHAYRDVAPDVTIYLNFASSGALQQQIEQGAPVDIFLSAAPRQMDALETKGLLVPETRRDFLGNQMVLVTSLTRAVVTPGGRVRATDRISITEGVDAAIASFSILTTNATERIVIGEPNSVPAGAYAKEVLSSLGLYQQLSPKLVFAKDVRQALAYVESGNVSAGLVYATDAALSSRVQAIATAPPESHRPIVYPIAVTQNSRQPDAARAFIDFLTRDTIRSTFDRYGFIVLP